MHAQLGQILDQKIQKDKKPNCRFWRAGSKNNWVSGAKAGYCSCPPALNTTKGWANHLSHPSGLTPGHSPTLTPNKEWACPTLGSKQGNLLLVFAPSCSRHRGPHKALPEFLVWPRVNFYWLGKAKNPGRYHFDQCLISLHPTTTQEPWLLDFWSRKLIDNVKFHLHFHLGMQYTEMDMDFLPNSLHLPLWTNVDFLL